MTNVVELVHFTLEKGVTKEDFLTTNPEMMAFLSEQEGMLYRSLCQQEDGSFIDIVYWEDMDKAKAGQKAFYESAICKTFGQYIDANSVKLEHVKVLTSSCTESENNS